MRSCAAVPGTRADKFFITGADGQKVTDEEDLANIEACLRTMIDTHFSMKAQGTDGVGRRPTAQMTNVTQPGLIYSLMDRRAAGGVPARRSWRAAPRL
jgi:hypothetical protein